MNSDTLRILCQGPGPGGIPHASAATSCILNHTWSVTPRQCNIVYYRAEAGVT